MMLALLLSIVGAGPTSAGTPAMTPTSDDPPVKVWLNHDDFRRGDKARVNVKLAEDGYVVVLRADADGRVRVLFPLDPSDDDFVRGGETIEVRGRGDREAFYVDDREGSGLVVAARSVTPFKFDAFVRGDHWDYRVLDARESGDDKEAALVDIVQRMTPDGHFDYDAATYVVGAQRSYRDYYPVAFDYGWGWPYSYGAFYGGFGSCYDPFFYDPFYCGAFYRPYFYDPFFYGGFGFRYRSFGYRPFTYGGGVLFYNEPHSLFVNRLRPGTGSGFYFKDRGTTGLGVGGLGTRSRVAQTTLFSGVDRRAVPVRERTAAFPVSDRPIRSGDRQAERQRVDRPAHDDGSSSAWDGRARDTERRQPESRGSERREPSRGADRPVTERPRERSGGGGGGGSSGGGRSWSPPPSHGGGGNSGASRSGGGGGGGGGGRRRP